MMMPKVATFENHHERYEAWFARHEAACISWLLALRRFVPGQGLGLEIDVGSGRFAAPLGVHVGIDPSPAMLARAAARGATTSRRLTDWALKRRYGLKAGPALAPAASCSLQEILRPPPGNDTSCRHRTSGLLST